MAQNWQTKLIHSSAKVPGGFRALSVPVERASTVVFPDCDSAVGGWDVEADGRLVRLSVGMEEIDDLFDDLKQALARMRDSH
jgi:cystathionine beta-lyase/cystathionine gamma-synthase